MTQYRVLLSTFAVLLSLLSTQVSIAQTARYPFQPVTLLVDWFIALNDKFDEVVTAEKQNQLKRKVDRMRKDLYALEADTRILLDNIPTIVPTDEQRTQLMELAKELMGSVRQLTHRAREIGADLRLNDAVDVDWALTNGLQQRGIVISYLQEAIEGSSADTWNAAEIRQRLAQGLKAVQDAQLAVTAFRKKLE